MNLVCDKCKKEFTPSGEQIDFIDESRCKGMKFIMIKCPSCSFSYPFNPMTLAFPISEYKNYGDGLRCPKKTCSGTITYIDDSPPFWGCGECGSVWFSKEKMNSDIEKIITKYPYRAAVYEINNGDCYPIFNEGDSLSYDEKIKNEWDG